VWRQLPYPVRQLYLRLRYGGFAVGVAALIQDQDGRVLLVHRTYSRDEPWAMPGGWLERGDRALGSALERELREETGLAVRAGRVRAVERAGFAIVVLIDVELVDGTGAFRPSAEVSEIAWVDPDRVSELSTFNARLLRSTVR
jgi:8-oxo-dGTP diphosphatase